MDKKYDKTFQVVSSRGNIPQNKQFADSRERWNYYTSTLEVAPNPLHVDIELTNACNIKCIMCERQNMKRKVGFMSFELFDRIIGQCADYGVDSIKLNLWGESTLHPDLAKMISHAKAKGILNTQFNTNGILMNEKLIREIFESGLDRMTFSVDGATRETYEKIRSKSDYDSVMGNLDLLFRLKHKHGYESPLITLQIIQMKDTEKEIEVFIKKWEDTADYITVTNIGTTSGMENNLAMSAREIGGMKKAPCPQLWQRLSVYWNGDVTVCCSDYNGFLTVGSIKDSTINELWHCNKLEDLRKRHKKLDFNGLICAPCTGNLA